MSKILDLVKAHWMKVLQAACWVILYFLGQTNLTTVGSQVTANTEMLNERIVELKTQVTLLETENKGLQDCLQALGTKSVFSGYNCPTGVQK